MSSWTTWWYIHLTWWSHAFYFDFTALIYRHITVPSLHRAKQSVIQKWLESPRHSGLLVHVCARWHHWYCRRRLHGRTSWRDTGLQRLDESWKERILRMRYTGVTVTSNDEHAALIDHRLIRRPRPSVGSNQVTGTKQIVFSMLIQDNLDTWRKVRALGLR